MDNRHIHIEKLINTLVVPKVNKILQVRNAPLIVKVVVELFKPVSNDYEYVSITIHYQNQDHGIYISVSSISYPISCMIVTILPYVLIGDFRISIINFLKDDDGRRIGDYSRYNFINFEKMKPFNDYLEFLGIFLDDTI